ILRIFAGKSMEAVLLFYWMGTRLSVLQKGQMSQSSLAKLHTVFSGQLLDGLADHENKLDPNLALKYLTRAAPLLPGVASSEDLRRSAGEGFRGCCESREWKALVGMFLLWLVTVTPTFAQSVTPAPQDQSQPHVTKSEAGKEDEAARAAARARNHHFD